MWDFAAIAVAFMLAFALKAAGLHLVLAWLAACCVVPVFLLIADYALPDGDVWPIAMFVEGIYGAAAGGVGALFATLMVKRDDKADAGQAGETGADV
jgi:hypothetical protein